VTPPPAPGAAPPPEVRLPLKFKATPEWNPADDGTMPVVHIHPQTEAADSTKPGKRIDSGNWFMNMGDYGNDATATAAHEYGHLLGIPDEYSQSNPQMHALMHQASPTISAGQDQALDDAATKWMVLRAMAPTLGKHAKATAGVALQAIQAKKADLEREMRAAIAGLWGDDKVIAAVKAKIDPQLTKGGHAALIPNVAASIRHEGAGLDVTGVAHRAVQSQLNFATVRSLIVNALTSALTTAQTVKIPITNTAGQKSTMTVSLDTSRTVNQAAAAGPLAQAANTVAAATMDARRGGGKKQPPRLTPSGSFLSQLQTMTAGWGAPNSTLGTEASGMKSKAASEYDALGMDAGGATTDAELAVYVRKVVSSISGLLGAEAMNDFLSSTFTTMMQSQIDAIAAVVQGEIDKSRTATPTGTNAAAAAAPDPRVAAAVVKVANRMQQLQKQPGTPVPGAQIPGATAPPTTQQVSFTVVSLMGSGEGGMRVDYLNTMVDTFNTKLKKPEEDKFKAQMAGGGK
jgi:hypothetical protein